MKKSIHILETIRLKPEFCTPEAALKAAQAYDDSVDDHGHAATGHIDHAHFYFDESEGVLRITYPWADRLSFKALIEGEDAGGLLDEWHTKYAEGPRSISVTEELPVEV
ncbi:MAG: hypothetical protein MI807_04030 [Verrucomicrobiales bacterium]|nr:hypothetical protein [Verrucomicrobiales bacterium]